MDSPDIWLTLAAMANNIILPCTLFCFLILLFRVVTGYLILSEDRKENAR